MVCRFVSLEVTKVEICALRHVAVELEPGKVIRPCVSTKSGISRRRIFPKLGMMLEDNKSRNVTRPDF